MDKCACRWPDAWRCAKLRGVQGIACACGCHEEPEAPAPECKCRKALAIQVQAWSGLIKIEVDGAVVDFAEAQIRRINAVIASPCPCESALAELAALKKQVLPKLCFGVGGGYGHDKGTVAQCPDCADTPPAEGTR